MNRLRKEKRLIDTFGYFAQSELRNALENSLDLTPLKRVLEIGSYEGIFTCYAAQNFADEVHTVDPFVVNDEGTKMTDLTERNFHQNLSKSTAVSKIYAHKTSSGEFFNHNRLKFDLVYVDGSHESAIVVADLESSINVCKVGGIIWVDDFLSDYKDLHTTIVAWLERNITRLEVIHKGYQLGVRKVK